MAVYFGTEKKQKMRLGSLLVRIPKVVIYEGVILTTIDKLKLKEADNLQITVKEDNK